MTPEEEQREAVNRAIQSFMDKQGQPAPVEPTPNPVQPPTVNPSQPDEHTMQVNPGPLLDAMRRKNQQQTIDDLLNKARQ